MRCDNLMIKDSKELVLSDNTSKIDIAVLIIFFNRPDKLKEVFDAVKNARPSRLYLYQDGAREGKNDSEPVDECRKIVSQIDWSCEVHRLYQTENFGCDPSTYIAHKWMFSNEEMGIVLEDDVVPTQCFFPFCKELLEKYRDNNSIAIICGMNNYDVENTVSSSYFFSKKGSIWGWASWKRFIDLWDPDYCWLNDKSKLEIIRQYVNRQSDYDFFIKIATRHKESGREHFESIMFEAAAENNMFNIVPKYNMICSIGLGGESTHSASNNRLALRRTKKLYHKKTYEIDFPLVHPTEIKQNNHFDNMFYLNSAQKIHDRIEYTFRRILFAKPSENIEKIKEKLKI